MQPRLVIVTGLSGAGRTEAIRAFEDLGYFCVDNLPPSLVPKFADLIERSPDVQAAALVMDIRGGVFFAEMEEALNWLDQAPVAYQIVFLEADEEALIQRYKMARRRHPLEAGTRLVEAIRQERGVLGELRGRADLVVNTTQLSPLQLRQRLSALFHLGGEGPSFQVRLVSFGFKHGLPKDADLVFDVRFLPNPHYVDELRHLTGNDPAVDEYVMRFPGARDTLARLRDLLEFLLPQFKQEGKPLVTVAVGCTGGQHRSVVFANRLGVALEKAGDKVLVEHRDLARADLGES
ncbi:MAG: RNase adapter RapZ [Thermaerobacter sp.]|nr:RNase adapter RapZ [Thermaerobacter sp.]